MKHYLHKFQDQTAYNTAKAGANFYNPAVSLIENDMSIVYDPLPAPPEMVDLGLPSGTLWATCNIGAYCPEDYGDYFAWGETLGYLDGKSVFNWITYKWCNGTYDTQNKLIH